MENENKGKRFEEELETEHKENERALVKLLFSTQRTYTESNKLKDRIIILLILLMFLEAVVGYCGVLWYESQFETVTTEQVELYTEGDEANAEYNDVEGDQYNDSAVHNDGTQE